MIKKWNFWGNCPREGLTPSLISLHSSALGLIAAGFPETIFLPKHAIRPNPARGEYSGVNGMRSAGFWTVHVTIPTIFFFDFILIVCGYKQVLNNTG